MFTAAEAEVVDDISAMEPPHLESVKQASERLQRFADSYKLTAQDRIEVGQVSSMSAAYGFAGSLAGATSVYAYRYVKNRPLTKPFLPFLLTSLLAYGAGSAVGAVAGFREYLKTSQSPLAREYLRYLAVRKAQGQSIAYVFRDLPLPSAHQLSEWDTESGDRTQARVAENNENWNEGTAKSSAARSRWDEIRHRAGVHGVGRATVGRISPDYDHPPPGARIADPGEVAVEDEGFHDLVGADNLGSAAADKIFPPQHPAKNNPRRNKYGDMLE